MKLEEIRKEVQNDKSVLRFSMDAKATVYIGEYSRGGRSRIRVHAADHDFKSDEKVTPYCIFWHGSKANEKAREHLYN